MNLKLDLLGELNLKEAKKTIQTVQNLDQKKLLDSSWVEAIQKQKATRFGAKGIFCQKSSLVSNRLETNKKGYRPWPVTF